ncbi:unnamed protein product [Phaeothamnion confervicola]
MTATDVAAPARPAAARVTTQARAAWEAAGNGLDATRIYVGARRRRGADFFFHSYIFLTTQTSLRLGPRVSSFSAERGHFDRPHAPSVDESVRPFWILVPWPVLTRRKKDWPVILQRLV